jgi:hypothetical protein
METIYMEGMISKEFCRIQDTHSSMGGSYIRSKMGLRHLGETGGSDSSTVDSG